MRRLSIIHLEYNSYNGFLFSLLEIETDNHQRDLLAIQLSSEYICISILFFKPIEIYFKP
jgi:hypothetical protein